MGTLFLVSKFLRWRETLGVNDTVCIVSLSVTEQLTLSKQQVSV